MSDSLPVNDLDHFVLAMGDKATVPAKDMLAHVESMISGESALFRRLVAVVPTAADDPGTVGDYVIDATHLYACVAEDTWIRVALGTWT